MMAADIGQGVHDDLARAWFKPNAPGFSKLAVRVVRVVREIDQNRFVALLLEVAH